MDDFSDGNLTSNPAWFGDVQDFTINEDGELQLFADDAGESFIYTEVSLGNPQLWECLFRMEFNPSSSNFCRIYLGLDDIDISTANGYYLECGTSGSDDAIELYQLINGNKTLLASGSPGAIALDPAMARVQFSLTNENNISLLADYNGTTNYEMEFSFEQNIDLSTLRYFGFYAKYTSTRKDKFFFDDVNIPDFAPPSISSLSILDPQTISLQFNEALMNVDAD